MIQQKINWHHHTGIFNLGCVQIQNVSFHVMCQWELMTIHCLWGTVESTAALRNANNLTKISTEEKLLWYSALLKSCNYCVYRIFIILSFMVYQRVVNAEVHKSWVTDCHRNYIFYGVASHMWVLSMENASSFWCPVFLGSS